MATKRIILDDHLRVVRWVAPRIDEEPEGLLPAIGIGLEQDGQLIAGVLYTRYTGTSMEMHVAAIPGRRWLTREYLQTCFAYPFDMVGCRRVTGLVRASNYEARRFDEHLGFKQEGVLRKAAADGDDIIVYGMLREECRWI
ncbi:GNAT family N-acetyltransferase [Schlegelella aquatica]|uniref:GNAT family N-acetyltransferase n=1 Tax=Caldimonas aquatica TaxID=376175 RepID=UPI003753AB46